MFLLFAFKLMNSKGFDGCNFRQLRDVEVKFSRLFNLRIERKCVNGQQYQKLSEKSILNRSKGKTTKR